MAINTLEYSQVFQTELDRQLVEEAVTGFMEDNAGQVKYSGGAEIKVPSMSMSGLAEYDRDDGYVQGAVTLAWQTMTMTQDRGRRFQIDAMDVDETNFAAAAGAVMGEFQRVHVIPEVDAYRISKLAGCVAEDNITTTAPAQATILGMLLDDISKVREITGDSQPLAVLISQAMHSMLSRSGEISHMLNASGEDELKIRMRVGRIDGAEIIRVPGARMKTEYIFNDGVTAGQTDGGFETAGGARDIRWIVMPKRAPVAISKTDTIRIFHPMVNQKAHAWAIDYRKYHDMWVFGNAAKGLVANIAE